MATFADIQRERKRRGTVTVEPDALDLTIQAERERRNIPPPPDQPQTGPGFLQRVGEDVSQRVETIGELATRRGGISPKGILQAPGTAALAAGQVAGGVLDVAGEAITTAAGAIIPEEAKEFAKGKLIEFSQTEIGKAGVAAIEKGGEAFAEFEKNFPDAALSVKGILNVAGLGIGTKGAKLAAQETKNIVTDVGTLTAKAAPGRAEKVLASNIKDSLVKAIRPGVGGKGTAKQTERYFKQADEAVRTIVDNKSILNITDEFGDVVEGLPTNLNQFSEAISATKQKLFTQFDDLAKEAGEAGAVVDLTKIGKELDSIIDNKGLQATASDIVNYAKQTKDDLLRSGKLTASEAQTAISALNAKLNTIKDFNSAAKSYVDSVVGNNLRKSLDEAVTKATGKEFQVLKNKYGALKTIEKDVNRRAIVDARKNAKGLIDFTDVFTGAEVVRGITTMQVGPVAAGTLGKFIASFTKAKNDPNKIISNMFKNTEKAITKQQAVKGPIKPQSRTGKLVRKQQFKGQVKRVLE